MSLFGTGTAGKPFGFGATTTTAPATNPFGATTTPAANPFGTTGATTTPAIGGLFGQSTTGAGGATTTGTGTGLFGTAPANTNTGTTGGGMFGGVAQPGTGLFGNAQPNTTGTGQAPPTTGTATTGTGLFGTAPAAPTTTAGTGLFGQLGTNNAAGNTANSTTGTGLFGHNPAGTAPTTGTGTGLFGQPATTSTTAPSAMGTGLFGQPATSTGAFGQPVTSTGAFGQPAMRPGMFGLGGSTGPSTGFGLGLGSTTQPQQASQQQPGALNAQGQALLGLLSKLLQLQQAIQASIPQGPLGTPVIAPGHQESLHMVGRLGSLLYGLTTEKFQHVFYNVVDPAQVGNYVRPPYVSDALWEKAVKENPDPRCMVPTFAMGMEDLQKRADAQVKAAETCKAKLDDIRTKLTTLSQRHVLSTSLRSQKLSNTHILLFQRVVRLSQHLHLLIPLIRSSAIRPEEEQLRGRLEAVEDELRRGSVSKGRMNEIWGVIGQLTALKAREGMGTGEGKEWAVVDEDGLTRLARILAEQQHGLAHLTKILRDGLRDLAVILSQAETLV